VPGVRGPSGRAARRPPAGVRHHQPVPPTHRPDGVPSRDGDGIGGVGGGAGGRSCCRLGRRFAAGGAPFSRSRVYGHSTLRVPRFAAQRTSSDFALIRGKYTLPTKPLIRRAVGGQPDGVGRNTFLTFY